MTAEHAHLLERDQEARRAAQSEFRHPLVLEAGAGTGKTTTLVARILAWGLGTGWAGKSTELVDAAGGEPVTNDEIAAAVLEGIVAITFTEAAAAEMAERVAESLAQVAAGRAKDLPGFDASLVPGSVGDEELPSRGRALLGALDRLTVRTIHSYCRGLLVAYPMEAHLHPELKVDADGGLVDSLCREVVEAAVKNAYAAGLKDPLTRLAARRRGPQDVAEILSTLASQAVPASALQDDPFAAKHMEGFFSHLKEDLDRLRELGANLRGAKQVNKAIQVVDAVEKTEQQIDSLSFRGIEELGDLCKMIGDTWDPTLVKRLGEWSKARFTGSEAEAFGEQAKDVSAVAASLEGRLIHLIKIDPPLLDDGRRALEPLLNEVNRRLQAQGIVTFQHLLVEARSLLASQPGIRARERRRIDQLLVDEFQDTDRIQCDIVRFLALDGPEQERPGLFVVGDPKQSIYGWRNADLKAYEDFVGQVIRAGGECLLLVQNFRSAPAVLDEVQRVIKPVMIRQPGLQPEFETLIASNLAEDRTGSEARHWAPVEYWVSWRNEKDGGDKSGPETPAPEVAELEATAIAADIRRLHDEAGEAWKNFGILMRSTGKLDSYLGALRDAGVPYFVTRDKNYYRRREIIEAVALVRTVLNPADHLAMVTFLRSAAVGVPDAALIPLWAQEFPQLVTDLTGAAPGQLQKLRKIIAEVAENLPSDIPGLERIAGWDVSLMAALENLAILRRSFEEDPPDIFLERLRNLLLLETIEAARYLGEFRLANLERFFRTLGNALEERGGDYEAILRVLRRSVLEAAEAEEALPKEAAEDAVQVLTIHSAKGLEFRHVYLVQLHASTRGGDSKTVDLDERSTFEQPLDYILFGSPTPGFYRVEERRQSIADAERVRTLYVAMTRAQDRLVLVGSWPEPPDKADRRKAGSYLPLVQQRSDLPPSLTDLRDQIDKDTGFVDAHGVRWKFPGYARNLASEIRESPSSSWLPSPSQVEAASVSLRNASELARQRMDRPFSQAASMEAADRLQLLLAEDQREAATDDGTQEVALAVGTVIHHCLETWDLSEPADRELERGLDRVRRDLAARIEGEQVEAAQGRATEILHRFANGSLLQKFVGLGPAVLGREIPVLLPPDEATDGPVGFVGGAIDLLYRDPETQDLVIVDFKTDQIETDEEISSRAAAYTHQMELYQRAVQRALELPSPPHAQLWFLWPDRVWE